MTEQKSNALEELKVEAEKTPGLVGFTCPKDNQSKPFEWCFKHCKARCEPLPILIAMSSRRKIVENLYSVTEILNPPQIVYMQRHFSYYVLPKNQTFITFGTGWHYAFERAKYKIKDLGLEKDYIIENGGKYFEVEIETKAGTANLRGTPDLYIVPEKHLWDFKTMKYYYTAKNLIEHEDWGDSTIPWQVNIYRVYDFIEAEKITVEALIKDFKRNLKEKGVEPIMQFPVPIMRDETVKEFVKAKLAYLLEVEKDPSILRQCTHEERWIVANERNKDHGKPLRCLEYCNVSSFCPQFQDRGSLNFEIPTCAEDIPL